MSQYMTESEAQKNMENYTFSVSQNSLETMSNCRFSENSPSWIG